MPQRYWMAVLVVVSWALVAVPAFLQLGGEAQRTGRWLVLATAVPLLVLLVRHLRVSRHLDGRNRSLAENVSQMELAEELAGVGRWCILVQTRQHKWSEEMCAITGLKEGTAPDDAAIATLFPDGLSQIESTTFAHREDRESFVVEFEIENPEKGVRILRARARNGFAPDGTREHIFMVVRDVTEDYSMVSALAEEREEALAEAERQRRLASTDTLTGLANRRHAMAELDRMIVCARSSGTPLSLLVFDLDHFKAVNDTHGHAAGDAVLKEVGRIVKRHTHPGQLAARIGGEEFVCILPGLAAGELETRAERLRLAIEAGTALAPVPPVTASIGSAMLENGETSLTFFARADAALFAAKRAGRNRISRAA